MKFEVLRCPASSSIPFISLVFHSIKQSSSTSDFH